MKRLTYSFLVFTAMIFGCKKAFNPVIATTNFSALVVEGFVDVGNDSTIIKLSRTVPVGNKTAINPETKATITVENAQGTVYALTETTIKGTYAHIPQTLDNTKQYRIRIKTVNGKTYLSDLVAAKITPPIDSIGFKIVYQGMQVYVNAHDVTNNTRYYRYSFSEAWLFNSFITSNYTGNDKGAIIERTPAQSVTSCYQTDTSATILNSTTSLSQDVVYQFPVVTVASTSEKIEAKYSILIAQQGLTKEAYEFWTNLKKNTQDLGSIFDAQPSQLSGNIHNLADASEPVIGYISAGTVQKKRIFISKLQLPQNWIAEYPYFCRAPDTALFFNPVTHLDEVSIYQLYSVGAYDIVKFNERGGGWLFSNKECADCTIRGKLKPPAFWK